MDGKHESLRCAPRLRGAVLIPGTFIASIILFTTWTTLYSGSARLKSIASITKALLPIDDSLQCAQPPIVDLKWYPPSRSVLNDMGSVVNGSGIYGYVFDSSNTPREVLHATYNYCNMPRARAQEYIVPGEDYELKYVEVIQRHHLRTPYKSNLFPHQDTSWSCDDTNPYYYGTSQLNNTAVHNTLLPTFPLTKSFTNAASYNSTCHFPQLTPQGLHDSHTHGSDLFALYHSKLRFLPTHFNPDKVKFRVTNNIITSQVASQLILGLYPSLNGTLVDVDVQPIGVDSLEPQYPCPYADALRTKYSLGGTDPRWRAHLNDSSTISLFAELDATSGVDPGDEEWHVWVDHYFDSLSSTLCHGHTLPCHPENKSQCITREMADAVFRRGLYEYSYIYRDASESLEADVAGYGIWLAELVGHLREAMSDESAVLYRHNIAHDGSISRLLSILQIEEMVWPGMGSEVVFELWRRRSRNPKGTEDCGCWYVRVLWKGEVLLSSNPGLGKMDMVPAEALLRYIDGLVGVGASKVPGLCRLEP